MTKSRRERARGNVAQQQTESNVSCYRSIWNADAYPAPTWPTRPATKAINTRPAHNQVIAPSAELLMTGLLRRDMASPFVASTHRTLAAYL